MGARPQQVECTLTNNQNREQHAQIAELRERVSRATSRHLKGGKSDMETQEDEWKEEPDRTCVSPLVSLQLVGARELPSAVCELALVGLLAWTRTRRQTTHV